MVAHVGSRPCGKPERLGRKLTSRIDTPRTVAARTTTVRPLRPRNGHYPVVLAGWANLDDLALGRRLGKLCRRHDAARRGQCRRATSQQTHLDDNRLAATVPPPAATRMRVRLSWRRPVAPCGAHRDLDRRGLGTCATNDTPARLSESITEDAFFIDFRASAHASDPDSDRPSKTEEFPASDRIGRYGWKPGRILGSARMQRPQRCTRQAQKLRPAPQTRDSDRHRRRAEAPMGFVAMANWLHSGKWPAPSCSR